MPANKCQIFRNRRVVRRETRERITFRGYPLAVLDRIVEVELVFCNELRPGFIRDIEEARPAPGAPSIYLLSNEGIGFAEQLDSTMSTGARACPVLNRGEKVNLGVRKTISKV